MGEVTPPGRGAPAAGDHRPSRREDRRGVRIRLRRDAAPELRGILRDEPHRLPPPLRCPRTHVSALAAARTDPLQLDRRATMTPRPHIDRKSTRLNSSHVAISYAVFCLKQKT